MLRFAVIRFFRGLVTILLVVSLVFVGVRLSGDPVQLMLGENAPPEAVEQVRENLGLNDPIPVQYARFVQSVATGDFGDSIREKRPVTEIVTEKIPATVQLAGLSILLTITVGLTFGTIAAIRRGSPIDRFVMVVNYLGQATPSFFFAILLIFTFTLWLGWLPSSGSGEPRHLVMPVLAMSFGSFAGVARLTRSSVLEVLSEDFVRTGRAKGLRESTLIIVHVLRNAAIPLVTMFGMIVGGAIAGSVVIETVFAWPGMGRLISTAVFQRDYPVIQMIVLLIAASVVLANFIVDLLYGWLDPRIREA